MSGRKGRNERPPRGLSERVAELCRLPEAQRCALPGRAGPEASHTVTAVVFLATAALVLDGLLGEPPCWHPLIGFGRMAHQTEVWLNTLSHRPWLGRATGVLAVLMVVAPPVLAVTMLERYRPLAPLLAVALLYVVIGHRALHEHAVAVQRALSAGQLPEARRRLGAIVSRDTFDMDAGRIAGATVESLLENGNDALFGALFWFLLAGAPGAVAYRLINTLDAMWGYRTDRYQRFGWAAARLDDLVNFLPARLTALSYAIVGHTAGALRCWRRQAPAWDSPNAGPVMSSGAGALQIRLGGGAFYHGRWHERPALGEGRPAELADILRARRLILRALLLWMGCAMIFVLLRRSVHA